VRLDHLLSKEHLHCPGPVYAVRGECQEYMPAAQAIVLRRVLTGGISTKQRPPVFPGTQYGHSFPSGEGVLERCGEGAGGFVFGTLLGPETTGPGCGVCVLRNGACVAGLVFLVSWLHRSCAGVFPSGGVVCGVCGTGLLFENYIVDASIFYKKQFPRI
jgi:hypothetical protein